MEAPPLQDLVELLDLGPELQLLCIRPGAQEEAPCPPCNEPEPPLVPHQVRILLDGPGGAMELQLEGHLLQAQQQREPGGEGVLGGPPEQGLQDGALWAFEEVPPLPEGLHLGPGAQGLAHAIHDGRRGSAEAELRLAIG